MHAMQVRGREWFVRGHEGCVWIEWEGARDGMCGPRSLHQAASDGGSPSVKMLDRLREQVVEHVVANRDRLGIGFCEQDSELVWRSKMVQTTFWVDYRFMMGGRDLFCKNTKFVVPAAPANNDSTELAAYGGEELDVNAPFILAIDNHFVALRKVGCWAQTVE